jgi:hypothetical protein
MFCCLSVGFSPFSKTFSAVTKTMTQKITITTEQTATDAQVENTQSLEKGSEEYEEYIQPTDEISVTEETT